MVVICLADADWLGKPRFVRVEPFVQEVVDVSNFDVTRRNSRENSDS